MTREEQAAEVQRQNPKNRREAAVLVARGIVGEALDLALNPPPPPPTPNAKGKKARAAKQAASVGA